MAGRPPWWVCHGSDIELKLLNRNDLITVAEHECFRVEIKNSLHLHDVELSSLSFLLFE